MLYVNVPPDPFREVPPGMNVDHNPAWVTVEWDEEADLPYRKMREEAVAFGKTVPRNDPEGLLYRRFVAAYDQWERDYRDPIKLFRATLYITMGSYADPNFWTREGHSLRPHRLDQGWSAIKNPPKSYEYVRRAYLMNAGDRDFVQCRDLAARLLARKPKDRGVVLAMAAEYQQRKYDPEFEKTLLKEMAACRGTKDWAAWDDFRLAKILHTYGQRNRNRDAIRMSAVFGKSAIARTGPGWDATRIRDWVKIAEDDAKHPNFGLDAKGSPLRWAVAP